MTNEDRINNLASPAIVSRVGFYVVLWDTPGGPVPNAQNKTHTEAFQRGAFSHSILYSDITATVDGQVVASKCSGSLRLIEDEAGLLAEMIVPKDRTPAEILGATKTAITFALSTRKGDAWNKESTQRVLTNVDLLSVGLIT